MISNAEANVVAYKESNAEVVGATCGFQTTDDPEGNPEGTFLKNGSSNFYRNYCYQAAVTKRVERTSRVGKDGNRISPCEI
jgi:hypothetical protein